MTETLQDIESEPHPEEQKNIVRENSIVTVRYVNNKEEPTDTFRLVAQRHGADELSIASPLGSAIHRKSIHDIESVTLPSGEVVLVEIIAIDEP